jgi:hypothetical protein
MVSHTDANPDANLEDSFNRQNSGSNLLDNSAMGIGENEGLGGHKAQFNISDDQIALHDTAKDSLRFHQPLGTTVPTMSQSQQQTPMQNINESNFRADFDNFTLTEEPAEISEPM